MSRVITVSRYFQKTHPKAGEPTWFVEKILRAFKSNHTDHHVLDLGIIHGNIQWDVYKNTTPKWHTIRIGNRWKPGMKFSPRFWGEDINPKSGKSGPYHSKQITFWDDIEVKETYSLTIKANGDVFFRGKTLDCYLLPTELRTLAANDGLSYEDFREWLIVPVMKKGKGVEAQIICWKEMDYDNVFLPF